MRSGFCVPLSGFSVPAFDVPSFLFQCSGFSVSAFRVPRLWYKVSNLFAAFRCFPLGYYGKIKNRRKTKDYGVERL